MVLGLIILVVFVLALVSVLPSQPQGGSWGYVPSGGLGLIVVVVLVLVVTGQI